MSRGEPPRGTDLNTLLAVLRHATVGRTALRVRIADDENGEEVVEVRMETDRMLTPSPASGGRGSLAPVFGLAGRRESDPRPADGVATYGIPEPEYDAPGPLRDLGPAPHEQPHVPRLRGGVMPRADLHTVLPRHLAPKAPKHRGVRVMFRKLAPWIALFVLGALIGFLVSANRADASVKPAKAFPVPCKSCTYWTADEASKTVDGMRVTIRGFAEHVVYRDGRDHIRNIAWAGETDFGPLAFDRVDATLRISRGGPPANPGTWVWDPAQRWGQQYVGRRNGRTIYGVDTVVVAWWRGQPVRVVVSPDEVVPGELGPEAAHVAPAGSLTGAR